MSKSFENSITVRDLFKIVNFSGTCVFFKRDSLQTIFHLPKEDVLSFVVVSITPWDSDVILIEVKEVDL